MDQISRTCSAALPIVDKVLRKTKPADIPDQAAAEFRPYNRKGTRRNRAADITCTRHEVNRVRAIMKHRFPGCTKSAVGTNAKCRCTAPMSGDEGKADLMRTHC